MILAFRYMTPRSPKPIALPLAHARGVTTRARTLRARCGLCVSGYRIDIASSPGHSHVLNATLKRREWPGYEARIDLYELRRVCEYVDDLY